MNNFYARIALLVLVAVGVYFTPMNTHLQNAAFILVAITMFAVYVRAVMKLKPETQESAK